jgi:hypothetical protein
MLVELTPTALQNRPPVSSSLTEEITEVLLRQASKQVIHDLAILILGGLLIRRERCKGRGRKHAAPWALGNRNRRSRIIAQGMFQSVVHQTLTDIRW